MLMKRRKADSIQCLLTIEGNPKILKCSPKTPPNKTHKFLNLHIERLIIWKDQHGEANLVQGRCHEALQMKSVMAAAKRQYHHIYLCSYWRNDLAVATSK